MNLTVSKSYADLLLCLIQTVARLDTWKLSFFFNQLFLDEEIAVLSAQDKEICMMYTDKASLSMSYFSSLEPHLYLVSQTQH